jgi:hypothetical protein
MSRSFGRRGSEKDAGQKPAGQKPQVVELQKQLESTDFDSPPPSNSKASSKAQPAGGKAKPELSKPAGKSAGGDALLKRKRSWPPQKRPS